MSCVYVVFEREAREYLFSHSLPQRTHSCHLRNPLTSHHCRIPYSQEKYSNVTEILNSRFVLEHRYGGNVDMLQMDDKERKRLVEQYNTDMEDRKYKEKALRRQFEEASENMEKTKKRLVEIEEKLANKIADNIRLTEENDTLQGSKNEMTKSLKSMKSMYDQDLSSREKLQSRCEVLVRFSLSL